jgi:SEC-C motif domain protein
VGDDVSAGHGADAACPCGRTGGFGQPLAYGRCCGPYLAGRLAPDPEALMRSRYTAYVRGDADHLRRTWDPRTVPGDLDVDPRPRWTGLEVLGSSVAGTTGVVEFRAHHVLPDGTPGVLHERSRFTRGRDGAWRYVDGEQPPTRAPVTGRAPRPRR